VETIGPQVRNFSRLCPKQTALRCQAVSQPVSAQWQSVKSSQVVSLKILTDNTQ